MNVNVLARLSLPTNVTFEYPVGLVREESDGTKVRLKTDAVGVAAKVRELGKARHSDLLNHWAGVVVCLSDMAESELELQLDDVAKAMKIGKKKARADMLAAITDRNEAIADLERQVKGKDVAGTSGAVDALEAEGSAQIARLKRSQEIFARVKDIATDPLRALDEALTNLGVAGERPAATAVYLAAMSTHGDKPTNIVVKAQSSSGKSFTAKSVLQLCGTSVKNVSSLSARAIIYDEPGAYAHTTIFLEEGEALVRKGDEKNDVAEMLRVLLSEGSLRHATVERDPDTGRLRTRWIEQEGPTGLITTTTRGHLDAEIETRVMSIWLNESEQQTKAIMEVTAKAAAGDAMLMVDFEKWKAFAEYVRLGAREVVVPYANALANLMPSSSVRARRDLPSILSLIKASAMVHRAKRKVDQEGRLIATLQDYEVALFCIGDAIAEAHGLKLSQNAENLLTGLCDKLIKPMCVALPHPDGTAGKTFWDGDRPAVFPKAPGSTTMNGSTTQATKTGSVKVEYQMVAGGNYEPVICGSLQNLATVLGISKSSAGRYRKHAEAEGLIEYVNLYGTRQKKGGAFCVTAEAWDALSSTQTRKPGLPTVGEIEAEMKAQAAAKNRP